MLWKPQETRTHLYYNKTTLSYALAHMHVHRGTWTMHVYTSDVNIHVNKDTCIEKETMILC